MRYARVPLDHAYLSSLLSNCGRERNLRLGSAIHAAILKTADLYGFNNCENHRNVIVIWNSLISMYSKCRELSYASKVFDTMKFKDTISWNSMISGCLAKGEFKMSFELLRQMQGSENSTSRFDHATLTTVLSVCSDPKLLYVATMMHSSVFLNGYGREISVGNALVTAYYKCGCSDSAQKVFDEMLERNVITWTAMISGLSHSQSWKGSLVLFKEMRREEVDANSITYTGTLHACSGIRALGEGKQIHGLVVKSGFELNLCTESALMDMYSKCGVMEDACQIFESCEEPDEVTNTVILLGFAQNGMEERAFELFVDMVGIGINIDPNIISAVLGAFGVSAPFALGKQVHSMVIKKSFTSNLFVGNGLINMYSKCGNMTDAVKVFDQMIQRNAVSWNSIIAAFARHGQGSEALRFYEQMKSEGMEPTDVTFLSLLHACSHVGSIEKGMEFLGSMSEEHGISPKVEHYACVVDMLGRAGRLDEAKNFIEQLPLEPNAHLWQALLGACGIYADEEMGMYAAQQLLLLEPECTAAYIVLANIYSSKKRWEERARVTQKMKEMGVKKDKGMSWIEVARDVHSFVAADRSFAS